MIDVHHVLFPTDLSAASEEAFAHARLFADRFGARLTIFHAVDVPWPAYARAEAGQEDAIRARWAEKARTAIEERFPCASGRREVLVRTDVSAPALFVDVALLDLIGQRTPDLVVMATHGRTGLSRAFMGSVAEQVVHQGGRPVLCVRPGARARLPYRRILVTTDLSAASRSAFGWAAGLGAAFESALTVLHVPVRRSLAELSGLAVPPAVPAPEDVRAFAGPEIGGSAEVRVPPPGPAWAAIVEAAGTADLIVMARRGHDSLGDRVLGSTTDRVLRHAPCGVLVV